MTQRMTATLVCDECDEEIPDTSPHHEVSYIVRVPDPNVENPPDPVAVMMHFHDECFDRTTVLQRQRIEKVSN